MSFFSDIKFYWAPKTAGNNWKTLITAACEVYWTTMGAASTNGARLEKEQSRQPLSLRRRSDGCSSHKFTNQPLKGLHDWQARIVVPAKYHIFRKVDSVSTR